MASNAEIRAALTHTLTAVFDGSWNVESRPPDSVQPSTLVVGSIDWEDAATDGSRTVTVPVWVVVSRRHPSFIDDLDVVTDPNEAESVPAAIDADPTLGGVVASARVESAGDYRDLEIAGTDYYGATLNVEVFC